MAHIFPPQLAAVHLCQKQFEEFLIGIYDPPHLGAHKSNHKLETVIGTYAAMMDHAMESGLQFLRTNPHSAHTSTRLSSPVNGNTWMRNRQIARFWHRRHSHRYTLIRPHTN